MVGSISTFRTICNPSTVKPASHVWRKRKSKRKNKEKEIALASHDLNYNLGYIYL